MNRYIQKLSLLMLAGLILWSCKESKSHFSISPIKKIIIQDKEPFMGQIYNITFKDKDDFFVFDSRNDIKEFRPNKSPKIWGKKGKGPCEHQSISNFAIAADSVVAIDRSQGKILIYGGRKGCREIIDKTVPALSAVQVVDDTAFFVRGMLIKSMQRDTPVIYRLDESSNTIVPTDVKIENLKINRPNVPLRIMMTSEHRNGKLYFYLPLTKKVFIYNSKTQKINSVAVDIYVAQDQNIYGLKDPQKFSSILTNDIEIVFDLFVLKKGFVLGYHKGGSGKNATWGLKVFSRKGKEIAQKKFEDRVVYIDDEGTLLTLHLDTANKENPYAFQMFKYQLP